MMGLSDGRKSVQIGLAVLIQYRSVTDTQPPSHVAVAITLNAQASSLIKPRVSSIRRHVTHGYIACTLTIQVTARFRGSTKTSDTVAAGRLYGRITVSQLLLPRLAVFRRI